MNTYRKTAVLVGVLYIIGTVAGVLSVVVTGPILGGFSEPGADYLARVPAGANQIILGALLVLIMGLALAMVPVVLYPLARKYNETLAVGYVVFRGALETVLYMGLVVNWLALIALGGELAKASVVDASYVVTLGALSLQCQAAIRVMTGIVFPLGALMLYSLLYQSRLVPRWLSGWGLLGAVLSLSAAMLLLFGQMTGASTTYTYLVLPLAVQEMVMAVWLIAKGFNLSATASARPSLSTQPGQA
ncbi:MAG: DUF4386 domain-containing protein [Anaerolineae bacterium]